VGLEPPVRSRSKALSAEAESNLKTLSENTKFEMWLFDLFVLSGISSITADDLSYAYADNAKTDIGR